MARSALALVALVGLLVTVPQAVAKRPVPIAQRIERLIEEAALGERVGIDVVRLHDGVSLYQRNADRPINPASNLKLLTAAAALWNLGPAFTAVTEAEGVAKGGKVDRLVLRAAGDPTLRYDGLLGLAEALRLRGVNEVEQIIIDDSYFDDQMLPPAFEQQPKEAAAFRSAIAAFSVDRNSYVVHVAPGSEVGGRGVVRVLADGYIVVDNRTTTKASGPPKLQIDHRPRSDGRLDVLVLGEVPATTRALRYRRRVPDPRAHAASLWVRALRQAGVGGALEVRYGKVDERLPVLAEALSVELSVMLYPVGKWSDNFRAEMLLKVMGAQARNPGSSAGGVEVVLEELAARGVDVQNLTLVNGSGLFDGNEVSPRHIAQTLVAAYRDPSIRAEYIAQLAIGGEDGTLHARLKALPRPRMVRAKTGTLRDVIALSGYVLGEPERSFAFSFLANGVAGRQAEARDLADAIVAALAEEAVKPKPSPH